jgi:hypothetical protein
VFDPTCCASLRDRQHHGFTAGTTARAAPRSKHAHMQMQRRASMDVGRIGRKTLASGEKGVVRLHVDTPRGHMRARSLPDLHLRAACLMYSIR